MTPPPPPTWCPESAPRVCVVRWQPFTQYCVLGYLDASLLALCGYTMHPPQLWWFRQFFLWVHWKKMLIRFIGVLQAPYAMCACVLMYILLPLFGCGFMSTRFAIRANDGAVAICGCVLDSIWPLNPARCIWGRGRRSKVRPCQLMQHCMPVWSRGL